MQRVSPNQIHRCAELKSSNEEFIQKLVKDSRKLYSKGLPIIFTLRHLSKLTDVNFKYLHSIVGKKINPYNNFSINKARGGKRNISSPNFYLRRVQDFIKQEILDTNYVSSQISESVFSYRKALSIVDNAKFHIGAKWIIKTDIENFFDSIKEYHIYHFFHSLGYASLLSLELSRLVTWPSFDINFDLGLSQDRSLNEDITFTSKYKFYCSSDVIGSLPQGAPTSPQLSNIIFSPIDEKFKILSEEYVYIYTRYADDLFFSTRNNIDINSARNLLNEVRYILNSSNYKMNNKKTKIILPRAKKVITGIVITDDKILLDRKFKDEIKMNIFFAEKNGLEAQRKFIKFHGNTHTFLKYLLGKLNFANQVEPDFANIWKKRLLNLAKNSGFTMIYY